MSLNTLTMKQMLVTLLLTMFATTCMARSVDNAPVWDVNMDRYLGSWYEIARFDHSFERGLTHATARYTLNPDGTISVINSGLKNGKVKTSSGKAKLTDTVGILRVSFFWPIYSDYRILMVDKDYRFALVGSKSDDYLWILSRTPKMEKQDLKMVLEEARIRGYDTGDLIWVEQDCDVY